MTLLLPLVADPVASIRYFPPVPGNGIYDPDRWLKESSVDGLAEKIAEAKEKGNTLIYVVILPELPKAEVKKSAMELGRAWAQENLWGMVFLVPGDDAKPQFFGELDRTSEWTEQQSGDFQNSIDQALAEARKRSEWQDDIALQVESGTRFMADEFGYLGLVMERIDHNNAQARGDRLAQENLPKKERRAMSTLLMVGILLALFTIFLLGFLMVRKNEEKGDEYLFPETSPRKRFLAPWSGGGNVLVQFASQEDEDDLRRD